MTMTTDCDDRVLAFVPARTVDQQAAISAINQKMVLQQSALAALKTAIHRYRTCWIEYERVTQQLNQLLAEVGQQAQDFTALLGEDGPLAAATSPADRGITLRAPEPA